MKHRMLLLLLEHFADRLFIFFLQSKISEERIKFRMSIRYFLGSADLIILTGIFANKLI